MSISVALVEDHLELLNSLAATLQETPDLRCVGTYREGESALREIPGLRPDVVVMDIRLPDLSGVECVRRLKSRLPDTQFLMLTVMEAAEQVYESICAGATGYVLKRDLGAHLPEHIRDLHAGGSPITPSIARKILAVFPGVPRPRADAPAGLSEREMEILELLAKGHLYKEIAGELGLSYHTIRTHVYNIYKKLQVRSRQQATRHLAARRC